MDVPFFSAFIDGGYEHKVLGKKLRPFCLWHVLLLQAIDSPFLRKGEVTKLDLRNAVAICQLRFGQSYLKRSIWPPIFTYRKFKKEVIKFITYTGDYVQRPEYSVEEHPEYNIKSLGPPPEALATVCDVLLLIGGGESRAWEMPLGMARWYSLMWKRSQGSEIDFLTDRDRELQAAMKTRGIKPFDPTKRNGSVK